MEKMAAKRFRLTTKTTNRSGAKRKMHKKVSSEWKTGKWEMEDGESGERFVDCIFNYSKSN